jgi:hypothetical protein
MLHGIGTAWKPPLWGVEARAAIPASGAARMGASDDDTAPLGARLWKCKRQIRRSIKPLDRLSRESATMRMKLTHITPMLAAGAAAVAIAAAPIAAAAPAATHLAAPSTAVTSQVVPAGFHGGGFHGGGFHGDRGGWGWPWGWGRRW